MAMTLLQVAEKVLDEEKHALYPEEIWQIAISRGYDKLLEPTEPTSLGKLLETDTRYNPSTNLVSFCMENVGSTTHRFILKKHLDNILPGKKVHIYKHFVWVLDMCVGVASIYASKGSVGTVISYEEYKTEFEDHMDDFAKWRWPISADGRSWAKRQIDSGAGYPIRFDTVEPLSEADFKAEFEEYLPHTHVDSKVGEILLVPTEYLEVITDNDHSMAVNNSRNAKNAPLYTDIFESVRKIIDNDHSMAVNESRNAINASKARKAISDIDHVVDDNPKQFQSSSNGIPNICIAPPIPVDDIPKQFQPSSGETLFDDCVICGRKFTKDTEYFINKMYLNGNCVYESAFCMECNQALYATFSAKSRKVLDEFIPNKSTVLKKRMGLILSGGDRCEGVTRYCQKCGVDKNNIQDYYEFAYCKGDLLYYRDFFPYMLCESCQLHLYTTLSDETRQEYQKFLEKNFGLPPDFYSKKLEKKSMLFP